MKQKGGKTWNFTDKNDNADVAVRVPPRRRGGPQEARRRLRPRAVTIAIFSNGISSQIYGFFRWFAGLLS